MKKRFQLGTKKQAFSIAYAIVALIVVTVLVIGLTPILTRKLPNLATSQMIKNPKGWYESYNAPKIDGSSIDCSNLAGEELTECNEHKNKKDCIGNPECNKYFPSDSLVPFDRYCKGNDNCTTPHQCENRLCHFEPRQGITKYEVFAIGGGGGAGSATKGDTNTVNKPLNTLTTDAAKKDKNNFIDTNRTNTNVQTDIAKSKGVEDGTILPNTDLNVNSASNFFFTVSEKKKFQTYPTKDLNKVLANASRKQLERINKETYDADYGPSCNEKSENKDKRCINPDRYYLYTQELGVLKYNQNPKYTLMPEWLKIIGAEQRYPCLDKKKIDKTCPPNDDSTISRIPPLNCDRNVNPNLYECSSELENTVLGKFDQAVAVACSGDGGNGQSLVYVESSQLCDWMKVNACMMKPFNPPSLSSPDKKVACGQGSSTGTESPPPNGSTPGSQHYCRKGYKTHNKTVTDYACKASCEDDCYKCTHEECDYEMVEFRTVYYNRICEYQTYFGAYAKCECPSIKLDNICAGFDKGDVMEKCSNKGSVTVKADPNTIDGFNALKDGLQQYRDMGVVLNAQEFIDGAESGYEAIFPDISYVNETGSAEALKTYGIPGVDHSDPEGYVNMMINNFNEVTKQSPNKHNLEISLALPKAGGSPSCSRTKSITRSGVGGAKGSGICIYAKKEIKPDEVKRISSDGIGADGIDQGTGHGCGNGLDGTDGESATACVDDCCTATPGTHGTGAWVNCDVCSGSGQKNGAPGQHGHVEGKCRNFSKVLIDEFEQPTPIIDKDKEGNEKILNGTRHNPGEYNWRYIWYMPFVTKHLMFGEAGLPGEEIHTMITLSEGQNLDINPGKSANKTDYKSGHNGLNGEPSTVKNNEAKVNYSAPGGKGGFANQKTDEYVLCHALDRQNNDINLPCYYNAANDENNNGLKRTHKIDKKGNWISGIQAIRPKESILANSIKMTKALRSTKPGLGSMGYGTKSKNDFVCNARRIEKRDQVSGVGSPQKEIYKANGKGCEDSEKIEYIIPTGAMYNAGTGAVIILW